MLKIKNVTCDEYCSSSSSSSSSSSHPSRESSCERINDFDRYAFSDAFPDEEDLLSGHDDVDARVKAITIGHAFHDPFSAPTPLAMEVHSHVSHSLPGLDKPFQPSMLVSKSKRPVTDFAISREEAERAAAVVPGSALKARAKPFVLLPCHFQTNRDLESLIVVLKNLFDNELQDVSYEFLDRECGFDAVYVRGSKYSDLRLRIYDNDGSGLIVEMQRLHKDSCGFTFKGMVDVIKRVVLAPVSGSPLDALERELSFVGLGAIDFPSADCGSCSELTDEELEESIKQVLAMASETSEQTQLDACRILCDLADQPDTRERLAATPNCVKTLVGVMKSERVLLRQHAVLAIAQLSECREGVNAIIEAGAIPALMELVSDGPYYTAAMRRESARALANVAASKALEIAQLVGAQCIVSWIAKIASLKDATVKDRAERARAYFQTVHI